jgi:hypothetical protein
MSVLDPKETYRNLKKKGFVDAEHKSVDHKRLELYHEGKFILTTKISHCNDDIRDPLIKQISSQCKLNKSEFMDLCKCPLSKEVYLKKLDEMGLLE